MIVICKGRLLSDFDGDRDVWRSVTEVIVYEDETVLNTEDGFQSYSHQTHIIEIKDKE